MRWLLATLLTSTLASLPLADAAAAGPDLGRVKAEITRRHDEAVARLQSWIKQPSIAAENRGMNEGCELLMTMLRDAGFQTVKKVPTDGQPGVFATLNVGAPSTVGVYFMYDVKQVDPAEWTSPPWEARLVDRPGVGKVIVGRGAVNQKGPESAFLAALHALKGAGQKPPVNVVLVAEGEEEIGSPHFAQVVRDPEVRAALAKARGIFLPMASQNLDGTVMVNLGAKGVVELELVSSGERWGRGPRQDIHSANKARVDSPAWHLVQALATMVTPDGNTPLVEGFATRALPLSDKDKALLAVAAKRLDEGLAKKQLGVDRWIDDLSWQRSLERFVSQPTINIEGLVGGYTGPGGKTVLPHEARAKLDLRLVPDMTAAESVELVKAHLAKKGFGDIEVRYTGGYDPTTTALESGLIQAMVSVYRRAGIDPVLWPRIAGSWPGYVFTGDPLHIAAGHFGLGHGNGAHAPDEFYVIEAASPKVSGYDGATLSYVEFLYELAAAR